MSADHILCVDDNDRNLKILQELLGDDHEVLCVPSGEAALDHLQDNRPSLVLMDVMMPGQSGLEICQTMRQDPATASIPVIIVSALTRDEDRERGFEAGAAAYLPKPFSPDELLDLVDTFVPAAVD